jgi:hypothetical protein
MKKSGFYFIEGMPEYGVTNPEPGVSQNKLWRDYKLWSGDLWECRGCGNQIISGIGFLPVSEHYKPEFKDLIQICNAEFRVNDC